MSIFLILALILGTGVMIGIMLYCRKWITIKLWKTALFSALLTLSGFTSVKIMYFFENGKWDGLSFFGAVLFLPFFLIILAFAIRERWTTLLDLAAPSVCGMLAIMKIECLRSGCCKGKLLFGDPKLETDFYFPSREVELITAIIIALVLIRFIKQGKYKGEIYPLFMIIYGAVRFIWNFFRKTSVTIWPLPIGNIWSLVSIAIGVIWLLMFRHYTRGKNVEGDVENAVVV